MSLRVRLLSASEIEEALPMDRAIQAMGQAFTALSTGRAAMPRRLSLPVPEAAGTLLVKPARVAGAGLGAKLVSYFPRNVERGRPSISGLVILMDPETGEPAALMDGAFLTAWRTGAASGLATRLLAPPGARVAGLLGSGAQARTQLRAIDAVRDLATVKVFARTPSGVESLIREISGRVRAQVVAAASPVDAVSGADIVCAATSSETPVFDGRHLAPGCHVNGVGSFTPRMRELDGHTVKRSRVFVDHLPAAAAEAGDLIQAAAEGLTDPAGWTEIGQVAAGLQPGRRSGTEITLFKSVGVAVQDIVAASHVLGAATERDLGRMIEI